MAYKKVTKHERFKENPFVEQAIEDITIVKKMHFITPKDKNEIQMIVSQSGVIEGQTAFLRYVEVDEDKFAKLYLSQLASFWELSKPAIRVFSYMLNILKPKQDSFILRMDECLEYTGYKHRKDINNGLSALIEAKIVARSNYEFEYFINPLVVFNGDRVTFAKTYVKNRQSGKIGQLDVFPLAQSNSFDNEKIQGDSQN